MKQSEAFFYLLRNKKFLIGIPVLTAVIAFIIAWILPPVYYTEIRLRLDDPNSKSGLSSLKLSAGSISDYFSSGSGQESKDLYMELLQSREIGVKTIQKFGLDTVYKKKSIDLTLKYFSEDLSIDENDYGIIFCGYESKNIGRAKELVRFMVQEANVKYMMLEHERMLLNTLFLRKKQSDVSDSLILLQDKLAEFHRDNRIVDAKSQIELSLQAMASYEQQLINLKMETDYLLKSQGSTSPAVDKIQEKVKILSKEYDKLRGGASANNSGKTVYVNTDWAMQKFLAIETMKSHIEIVGDILALISKELALAESQSSRNQPVVQIIQDSYQPDWKVRPKRLSWALAAFSLSFVLAIVILLLHGLYHRRIGSNDEQESLRSFIQHLIS